MTKKKIIKMKLIFKGKTAVVTGASGGMGLETTKKLITKRFNE